jgi:hypothetical protein
MMNRLSLCASLILLAVSLAACASPERAATNVPPKPAAVELSATPSPEPVASSTPVVDLTATYILELLSATPPVDAQPVATSRGPELHATDPTTVSLASGGLQFVEFFEFW